MGTFDGSIGDMKSLGVVGIRTLRFPKIRGTFKGIIGDM